MVRGSNCLSRAREGKGRDCGEGLAIHLLHTCKLLCMIEVMPRPHKQATFSKAVDSWVCL